MKSRIIAVFVVISVCFGAVGMGCGDDDDGQVTFKAYVQHFGGDDWVANVEIRVLDNQTGNELGITGDSDLEGWITFSEALPSDADGLVGFRAVGGSIDGTSFVDTYNFNIDANALDERLWLVDLTTYDGAPLMAGVTKEDGSIGLDPGTAVLAGGVYFVEENGLENHIGCATAKLDPESGQVRYFGSNGTPTTLASRSTTNPLVAYYLVANIAPGKVTARAYIDDQEIGSTGLHVFADAVSISNIYAEGASEGGSDPEPADCE
jgi:hypothetical protein